MNLKRIMTAAIAFISAVSISNVAVTSIQEVSAREDGYYGVGNYIADVSDFLSLRKSASTSSERLKCIPAKSNIYVSSVVKSSDGTPMGKVSYDGKIGYVNLKFTYENYKQDGVVTDKVPKRYSFLNIRSGGATYFDPVRIKKGNTYIDATLPSGVSRQRQGYSDLDRRMAKITYNGVSGYINLDYTEFDHWN